MKKDVIVKIDLDGLLIGLACGFFIGTTLASIVFIILI